MAPPAKIQPNRGIIVDKDLSVDGLCAVDSLRDEGFADGIFEGPIGAAGDRAGDAYASAVAGGEVHVVGVVGGDDGGGPGGAVGGPGDAGDVKDVGVTGPC